MSEEGARQTTTLGRAGAVLAEESWQHRAVAAVLAAFESRDCDQVLALATDDIVFEFPLIGDGCHDAEGFKSRVGRTLPLMEGLTFSHLEVAAAGESLLATYRGTATITLTSETYAQRYFSVLTFEDGKLTYFQENFDTAEFKRAFGLDISWRMR